MSNLFSEWFWNLLNNWNIFLNSNFNYSFFYIYNLNNFFNCLNDIDRFLNYIGYRNSYLLFHFNNLWNINKIVDNFFNLDIFNLLNWNLFNNFHFLNCLDLSYNINQSLLESINNLNLLLNIFCNNRNFGGYLNWDLSLNLLNNRSIDFNNLSLNKWLFLYYLNLNRNLSVNNSINNNLSNYWNLNS